MHNQTQTLTQTGTSHYAIQDIKPDYTGIYYFCGTILILGIFFAIVANKISDKWRIDHFKLKQLEINKTCEQNISLLRKLDKVLEILIDGKPE